MKKLMIGLALFLAGQGQAKEVIDTQGRTVNIPDKVEKLISLSPHVTETLYYLGAQGLIRGASSFSNYPEEAKKLPRVGDYYSVNVERILEIEPDLVLASHGGPTMPYLEILQQQGIAVYYSNLNSLADISKSIKRLGQITGREKKAVDLADEFNQTLTALKRQTSPKSVFYQIWYDPIITINGETFINEVLELCGGENIFKALPQSAPQVSAEAVLAADPSVIFVHGHLQEGVNVWEHYTSMSAVKNQQVYIVSQDLIARPTPTLLKGARQICEFMASATKS